MTTLLEATILGQVCTDIPAAFSCFSLCCLHCSCRVAWCPQTEGSLYCPEYWFFTSVDNSARISCACDYAGNLKLTFPIAAATFQMAWGIASLPGKGNGVDQQVFTEIRWATDYLLACYSGSSLIIQARLSASLPPPASRILCSRALVPSFHTCAQQCQHHSESASAEAAASG